MILLENGAIVLQIVMKKPETGSILTGVCLANWRDKSEIVVWNVYQAEDGKYYCEHGHYFRPQEMKAALVVFMKRALRFMGWEPNNPSLDEALNSGDGVYRP